MTANNNRKFTSKVIDWLFSYTNQYKTMVIGKYQESPSFSLLSSISPQKTQMNHAAVTHPSPNNLSGSLSLQVLLKYRLRLPWE